MNKTCDITNVVLSDNVIDYVHKTKYLGVLLCSDMKISDSDSDSDILFNISMYSIK